MKGVCRKQHRRVMTRSAIEGLRRTMEMIDWQWISINIPHYYSFVSNMPSSHVWGECRIMGALLDGVTIFNEDHPPQGKYLFSFTSPRGGVLNHEHILLSTSLAWRVIDCKPFAWTKTGAFLKLAEQKRFLHFDYIYTYIKEPHFLTYLVLLLLGLWPWKADFWICCCQASEDGLC